MGLNDFKIEKIVLDFIKCVEPAVGVERSVVIAADEILPVYETSQTY